MSNSSNSSYDTVPGIYGRKQTESNDIAQGQGYLLSHKFLATCVITTTD